VQRMGTAGVPAGWGGLRYVLCHGVYSWVPGPVQDRILEICRQHLAPQGVAYVSYNTYPGWHARAIARDLMRFHVRRLPDPPAWTAAARDVLAFLLEAMQDGQGPYLQFLKVAQPRSQRRKGYHG